MEKKIEVAAYQKKLDEKKQALKKAKSAVDAAQKEVNDFEAVAQTEIASLIVKGATTGDELQDEVVMFVGFEADVISRFELFNKMLQKAKGKELLIEVKWDKQFIFRMSPGQSKLGAMSSALIPRSEGGDTMPTMGHVIGVLSGERLRVKKSDIGYCVVLPFVKYAFGGLRYSGDNNQRKDGPLTLELTMTDMDVAWLSRELQGTPNSDVDIHIGTLARKRCPRDLLELLDAPTVAEELAGRDI